MCICGILSTPGSAQNSLSTLTHACFHPCDKHLFPLFFFGFRYFQKGYYRFEHYIVLFSTFAFVFLVYIVIIQVRTRRSNQYLKVNRFREIGSFLSCIPAV